MNYDRQLKQAFQCQEKLAHKYRRIKKEQKETRQVIKLYEDLLDKLTEQNSKLKDWIESKKRAELIERASSVEKSCSSMLEETKNLSVCSQMVN